ncbi:MAG: TauD/TfdA family dioxygenase [Burkholderiaceae bacterium]
MAKSSIQIEPGDGVGAYISAINLKEGLTTEQARELKRALGEYGVLFFRDQDISPEQHIAFAEQFGAININRFFASVDNYPMIAEVRKEPDQKVNIGGQWHTDHSYDIEPALGSVLLARQTPTRGGDTLFANMYTAYESLSDGMKKTLATMRAVHSSRHQFGAEANYSKEREGRLSNRDAAQQDSVHPVVITHPISGRKALYVNTAFTIRFDGWTADESEPLLKQLYEHAARPEFTHRFHWAPGSIAFWDNRATQHYALNDYQGQFRLMHRITVEGEALPA